jgi:hypothetical protein
VTPIPTIEILPNRTRAVVRALMMLGFAGFFLFSFFNNVNGNLFDALRDPGAAMREMNWGPILIAVVALLAFVLIALLALFAFMPNPIPRLRITETRLEVLGFWGKTGFAWQDFGAFIVKKTRGKASTVQLRVLKPADVGRDLGIAGWFSDNSIAKIDIAPYVPLLQKTAAEGEHIARWIESLREDPNAQPPASLTVRRLDAAAAYPAKRSKPASAAPSPKPTIAKVTANQTVVRR